PPANDLLAFKPLPRPPHLGRSPGPVPNQPPLDSEPSPTQRHRCRGRNRPEITIEADGPVRTSSSIFSFNSPPNRSSKRFSDLLFMDNQASEVQPISRRNLQRAKLARTICCRSAQDPPPGHS
ncbi:pyrimidine 2, partial [Prunus dulcis]